MQGDGRKVLDREQMYRLVYYFTVLGKLYVPVQERAARFREETSDGRVNNCEVLWEN